MQLSVNEVSFSRNPVFPGEEIFKILKPKDLNLRNLRQEKRNFSLYVQFGNDWFKNHFFTLNVF